MYIVLIISGIFLASIATFIAYRLMAVKLAQMKGFALEQKRMGPFVSQLKDDTLSAEQTYYYARNLLTRVPVFQALKDANRLELFPDEFNTIERGAESSLARWLEFPTELGKCPDEIEHVKKITKDLDGKNINFVYYHVFRFRTFEPHWSAKDGWSLGVVGPFFDDSTPYAHCTPFSRIGPATSPEEEVDWVHNKLIPHVIYSAS